MARKNQLGPLSAAQMEIVRAIWAQGEASVTEVWKAVCERKPVARGTVQTVIQRLEAKGWLRHREVGQTFLYSVCCSQESAESRFVSELLESAFGGSTTGLVKALLHRRSISPEEADRIRDVIAAAEKGQAKKGKKR